MTPTTWAVTPQPLEHPFGRVPLLAIHTAVKVAFQNGFRRTHGETDGWQCYSSTTAQGSIWLARNAASGWLLALDHGGVVEELDDTAAAIEGPGLARYAFVSLGDLHALMPRVYQLAASLPDAPLAQF